MKIPKLFLVSKINSDLTKTPLFVTNDNVFGVNYFNQWKKVNGLDDVLCQVTPIEFIHSKLSEKTDIPTTQFGDNNDN